MFDHLLALAAPWLSPDRTVPFIYQKTLKQRFREYTIITIAHRLNTIADYDLVIVMDKGKVVQMGSPFEMTTSPTDNAITKSALFAEMVKSTGDNATNIFRIARNKHNGSVSPTRT